MSQNSLVVADGTGAAVLSEVNNALNTLVTQNSGATDPATQYAYQRKARTDLGVILRRNAANSANILDGTLAETLGVGKSGAFTAGLADFMRTFVCAGTWSVAFDAVATLGDGWCCWVKNGGSGTITLDPNASEQINGAATVVLAPGEGCVVKCDGTALVAIGGQLGAITQAQADARYILQSSSPAIVSKRQTVLAGAAAIVQIGTGLACNLLAAATSVRIAYPGGIGANGDIDYIGSFTADQASYWSGLTANTTNYLFSDRNSGTGAQTGVVSTLPYIAQLSGGSISTVNGQHTYEYDTGVMWVGNGSSSSVVQRTAVGECVCGASAVTSVITYAKQREFTSSPSAIALNTAYNISHNLGVRPKAIKVWLKNTTIDNGWQVGEEIDVSGFAIYGSGVGSNGLSVGGNRLISTLTIGGSLYAIKKDASAAFSLTLASWAAYITIDGGF